MQLRAEARARAVDVQGGTLDAQRGGDAAGLGGDDHVGAASAGDDHADVAGTKPCALERHRGGALAGLDVRVEGGLLAGSHVGVAGGADVVEGKDGAPLSDPDALDDPLVRRADVELLEEPVVDDRLRVEVTDRVKVEGVQGLPTIQGSGAEGPMAPLAR